jgi:hypothetical protein
LPPDTEVVAAVHHYINEQLQTQSMLIWWDMTSGEVLRRV